MSFCRNGFLFGLVLAFSLELCAAAAGAELQKSRFTNIRGMHVENKDGEKLGEIKDFVIELETGEVKYAIIKSHGFFGLEAPNKIVPARLLSNATIKKRTLEMDLSLSRLKNGPTFKKSEIGSLREPHRSREILSYYYGPTLRSVMDSRSSFSASGTNASTAHRLVKRDTLQLAGDIPGWHVSNHRREDLGKVSDILIDLSWERPVLVIISKKGLIKRTSGLAVPLNALDVIGPRTMVMKASHVTIEEAPWLSERDWHALQSNTVSLFRISE